MTEICLHTPLSGFVIVFLRLYVISVALFSQLVDCFIRLEVFWLFVLK